jgi:CRISPR-associated protein Cas1
MTDRIIDLADKPVRLSVRLEQLVIEYGEDESATVPLEEVGVVVVSHPQVSFTHAVLAGIAAQGGTFVVCNEKHMPVGMILPLESHHLQSERFARQAAASLPTRKRLWQQLISAKVKNQGHVLQQIRGDDHGLLALARMVKSGDRENVESRAARIYWRALFEDPGFRRDPDGEGFNGHLNYGYAVLRAIVARAICAAGLHPALGLHHHNRYDTFTLASDLMEPLRPLVDRAIVRYAGSAAPDAPFDRTAKTHLLTALTGRLTIGDEERTLFDVATTMASSLAQVHGGQRKELLLPEIV